MEAGERLLIVGTRWRSCFLCFTKAMMDLGTERGADLILCELCKFITYITDCGK